MNRRQLSHWCAQYKRAWETQDPDLFVTLFSSDCGYRDTPFTEPIPGRAFHKFWRALAEKKQDNRIEFEILGQASGNRAILKWDAISTRRSTGERREGCGIFLLTFGADNRCSDVWEWQHWHLVGTPLAKPIGFEGFTF